MEKALGIISIIISILLVVTILLQSRGTGLGAAFGGEGSLYQTRRGFERMLLIATIVLGVLFFAMGLASTLLPAILK